MKILHHLFLITILLIYSCSSQKSSEKELATETKVEVPKGEYEYSTDSVNMKGYFATKIEEGKKVPGILVIHEWWGHNDYARKRADMIAELGYVALAIDMYGEGKTADHPDDAGKFAGMVFQNIDQSKAKFEAALSALKNHPHVDPEKIGAIGYCFGGTVALNMVNAGYELDAVAAFHSGLNFPIQPSSPLNTKVLVCNGGDDPFVSPESILTFKSMMDSINADYEYVAYPGAVHSFTSREADANGKKFNLPLAYNEEADVDSWDKMKALFESVF